MHYYPHHIGDFIADTARITDSQCMAYLRLMWHYYDTEKPLENDPESLAFRIGSSTTDVSLILKHYFTLVDGVWRHARCDSVISEYHAKADKARKSAEARWSNYAKAKQSDSKRNANASKNNANEPKNDANQEPITNNQEPLDITPTAKTSAKSSMVTFTQWIDGLNESGEDAIPADHPIFEKAQAIGISRDYLALAWYAFRRNYTNEASKSFKKKYAGSTGWRRVFVTAVMEDWLKLWQINGQTNEYYLTTKGKQLMQEMNNENV